MKLNASTLAAAPPGIIRPAYDRGRAKPGIAHLSVGNFHRAHQAFYLDQLLAHADQQDWGLLGIGIIDSPAERAKAAALQSQDGLYTLTEYATGGETTTRIIGSLLDYVFAPDDQAAAIERLRDPAIRIITLTVTEGGYNRDDATGRFRLEAPEIVYDLANPSRPRSVFGLIVEALARRRADGMPAPAILSCDNMRHNGAVTRDAVLSFARAREHALARWIEDETDFPSAMVDGITPAVGEAERGRLNASSGIDDGAPIFCEPFRQWVIEDRFRNGRPALERVGVQFTDAVDPYERIKLRMLNAAHSMLAYPSILAGLAFVHDALAEPRIEALLRAFLDRDVIPHLHAPPGMTLPDYRDLVLSRFANKAIGDQIPRIAFDGAAKLPVFLGDTARDVRGAGTDPSLLAYLAACYVRYLRGGGAPCVAVTPNEPHLTDEDRERLTIPSRALFLSPFEGWGLHDWPAFQTGFAAASARIDERGPLAAIEACL